MDGARGFMRGGGRAVAVAAAVVVLMLLAVAPALAATQPTALTATAGKSVVPYGGGTYVTAVLTTTSPVAPYAEEALGGQWLRFEQTLDPAAGWDLLYLVTTGAGAAYYTGTYTVAVLPEATTTYRFVFPGTAQYEPSESNWVTVAVRPLLGRPVCPALVKRGVKFTVYGSLKPHFPAGQKLVKVRVYRLKGTKWVYVKSVSAVNRDYGSATRYKAALRLTTAGKYRFKATMAATAGYTAAKTGFSRTLVVK